MALMQHDKSNKTRFLKTLALWSGYLALGMSVGIKGPTLLDLREQVSTSLTGISFALTARAGGYVIGSVLSK